MLTASLLHQLAREAAPGPSGPHLRLALLGQRSTQFLADFLQKAAQAQQLALALYQAPYDQVEAQLLDPQSGLYAFAPQYVLLIPSEARLRARYYQSSPADWPTFFTRWLARLEGWTQALARHSQAELLLPTFPLTDDGAYGHYAAQTPQAWSQQVRRLNLGLLDRAEAAPRLHLYDLAVQVAREGWDTWQDRRLHLTADIPYRLDAEARFAYGLIHWLRHLAGRLHKVVVLDLDGLLWGGVIGEDGLPGIELGPQGMGLAFRELQQWLRHLRQRGILLAVCSKNDEATAWEPFDAHPHMRLRRADIACFVANWHNKADNLRHIQQQLGLGFDSMIFLDDSPAERALIRQELPAVTVPELPADPAQHLPFLQAQGLFEGQQLSAQDQQRTAQYQADQQRRAEADHHTDLAAFLDSLAMQGEVVPLVSADLTRLAQLSQRSNQFNLRTVRYQVADLQAIAADPDFLAFGASLSDRFGPHGLISLLVARRVSPTTLFLENWCVSCRVLARGVEGWLLNHLAQQARSRGYQRLVGEYVPTARNALVADLYPTLGFQRQPDGRFALDLAAFQPLSHAISAR